MIASIVIGAALVLVLLQTTPPTYVPAPPRDPAQVRLFRTMHACPSTNDMTGACPGWVVDHIYPLCAGGKDLPSNMAWQEQRQSYLKDRLERDFCRCLASHAP